MVYSKKTDVRYNIDVLIVGRRPAGCAVAWAAAKTGAKVFLPRVRAALGGLGTAGMVPLYMLYGDTENGVNGLTMGFGSELFERLKQLGENVGQP